MKPIMAVLEKHPHNSLITLLCISHFTCDYYFLCLYCTKNLMTVLLKLDLL